MEYNCKKITLEELEKITQHVTERNRSIEIYEDFKRANGFQLKLSSGSTMLRKIDLSISSCGDRLIDIIIDDIHLAEDKLLYLGVDLVRFQK